MATAVHPTAVDEPTIYSHLIAQVGFQLTFIPIYDRLISRGPFSPGDALHFDAEIAVWENSLPPYFRESFQPVYSYHRFHASLYRLKWRTRSLRMLIFFPAFLHWAHPDKRGDWDRATDHEQQGVLRCLDYAHQNVTSIQDYFLREPSDALGEWYAL